MNQRLKAVATAVLIGLAAQSIARAGDSPVRDSDQVRFGWYDVKTTVQATHTVFVEAKLCAAEKGSKDVKCVSLGKFKPVPLRDGRTIEVKRNSPALSGTEIAEKTAELTRGMRDPIVRMEVVMHERRDDGSLQTLAHKYLDFPPLNAMPKSGDKALQLKVQLESDVGTARVLAEIQRR